MLWTLALIALVLWALGLLVGVAGSFVHALLIIAAILAGAALIAGRRRAE
jgi:hypothetical protein